MAFTLKITGADVPFIYNVAHGVGPGRSNVRDDVMLVQTLLKLAAFPMEIHGTGGTSEGVQVDGIFGDQTKDAIEQFEKFAKKDLHKLLVADGVVSRCRTDAFVPGAGVQFKIVHLNRAVRKRPVAGRSCRYCRQPTPSFVKRFSRASAWSVALCHCRNRRSQRTRDGQHQGRRIDAHQRSRKIEAVS